MTEKEHGSVAMGDIKGWFVKDFADGWIYFDNEADAKRQVDATSAMMLVGFHPAAISPVQEPVAFITPSALADLRREIGGLYQMKPPRWTNEETTVALYLAAPQPAHGTSATERGGEQE